MDSILQGKVMAKSEVQAVHIEDSNTEQLTFDHRQYLLARHGTLDLDPIPDPTDADPFNWPQWKKLCNLTLVAFHALMSTFTAASIIPAYETIATDLKVTLQRTTYLTSLQIAILGAAPLLWRPLSSRYGRRPIFLISLICSLIGNIGCAKSPDYASMAGCRALVALFICPAGAIGSAVVTETFFRKQRARYMGIWTLLVTLGVPLAPFIFGFVTVRVGYRWIYYILAIINAVQFLLYLALGPETLYIRGSSGKSSMFRTQFLSFRRINPQPLNITEFFRPLSFATSASVMTSSAAYAMIFLFASVMLTVEVPQLFGEKFHFDAQQLGLQFLGVIIGSVLGEQVGGFCSDWWMARHTRKLGHPAQPEYRLWLSYLGYPIAIMGVVVFLCQTENAPPLHWNVTPIVGAAFAAGGNQIITTVLVTYAVDKHQADASGVGVFITFVRQTWAFIGPFWFPAMFESLGLKGSAGLAAGLMIIGSIIPTAILHFCISRRSNSSSTWTASSA